MHVTLLVWQGQAELGAIVQQRIGQRHQVFAIGIGVVLCVNEPQRRGAARVEDKPT